MSVNEFSIISNICDIILNSTGSKNLVNIFKKHQINSQMKTEKQFKKIFS
jgi:hypothetical protein